MEVEGYTFEADEAGRQYLQRQLLEAGDDTQKLKRVALHMMASAFDTKVELAEAEERARDAQEEAKLAVDAMWEVEARLSAHLPGMPGSAGERVDDLAAKALRVDLYESGINPHIEGIDAKPWSLKELEQIERDVRRCIKHDGRESRWFVTWARLKHSWRRILGEHCDIIKELQSAFDTGGMHKSLMGAVKKAIEQHEQVGIQLRAAEAHRDELKRQLDTAKADAWDEASPETPSANPYRTGERVDQLAALRARLNKTNQEENVTALLALVTDDVLKVITENGRREGAFAAGLAVAEGAERLAATKKEDPS